jgi:AhpD family alkylhydroperoxidase
MESRIDLTTKGQGALTAILGLAKYLAKSTVEQKLLHLIELRASQINGCAFCIDMHSKDLRHEGDTEQRLYLLDAWRESPFYTDRERAALAWTEALTLITEGHVPDEVFDEARKQFSEEELIDLTLAICAINSWTRLNIAFRTPVGMYQPGQFAAIAS